VTAPSDPPQPVEDALQLTVADANAERRWQLHGGTVIGSAILCTITSSDGRSGVARFAIQNPAELGLAASYGPSELFAARESAKNERFVCLTISPRGELVLGHQVEAQEPEGQITFYRVTDGAPLLRLATHLPGTTALTYSPRQAAALTPPLYVLNGHQTASEGGGLYRLDAALVDRRLQIRPVQLAPLDHPTAMAWGSDGALYVTLLGIRSADSAEPAGKLVRFPPGL
jgi:hypothetical protein